MESADILIQTDADAAKDHVAIIRQGVAAVILEFGGVALRAARA